MSGYCLSIDSKYDGYLDLVKRLGEVEDYIRILGVSHKGDSADPNPHWHIVIATECKEKAFRKRMKNVFDKGKGNGHMSLKPWDGRVEAYSYMFHEDAENADIVINKGHSEEDISKYISMNNKVQVLVNEAKKKASYRLEALALEYFKREDVSNPGMAEVAYKIMEIALDNDMYPPSDWHLKAMAIKVSYTLSNGEHRHYLIDSIVKRALRLE